MLLGVCAALLLVVVGFVPGLRESFEIPKAALLRASGIGLLPPALAAWRSRRLRWSALDACVTGWVALVAAATAASVSPLVSLVGEPVQREGLLTTLAAAGLYAAARVAADPGLAGGSGASRRCDVVTRVTLGAAVAASAYALLQAAGLDPLSWRDAPLYGSSAPIRRPFGTLGHPNLLGVVTAAAAAAAAALAVAERHLRALWLVTLVALAAVTLITLSRAAWLGLAAGGSVGLLLGVRTGGARIGPRGIGLAVALVAVCAVLAIAMGWGGVLAERMRDLLTPGGGTGASRLEIWRSAVAAWRDRPLLGQGPATFALVFPRFQTQAYWEFEWGGLPFHAHSIYLQILTTHGALGLAIGAAWAACLIAAAGTAWRSADARLSVAALLASLVALGVAGLFGALGLAGQALLTIDSGLLAAMASSERAPQPAGDRVVQEASGGARRAPIICGWALAAAIALGAVAELRAFVAASEADRAMARARALPPEESVADREQALAASARLVRLAPWEDEAHRLRAEALLSHAPLVPQHQPSLDQALAEARRALALVPARAENHEELARVLSARFASGDRDAAGEALREIDRTLERAPVNARLLDEAARLAILIERPDRARELAARAAALYPKAAAPQASLALAELVFGRREVAVAALEQAMSLDWHGDDAGRRAAEELLARLR